MEPTWHETVYDEYWVPTWTLVEEVYHAFASLAFELWLNVNPTRQTH